MMGRFTVDLQVVNYQDVVAADVGALAKDKVRQTNIKGIVDTGAARLILPESAVQTLGLPETGPIKIRYADGREEGRKLVGYAEVTIQDRTSVFSAVVEPNRTDALIGAIVLEELDFTVDCTTQTLVPRDPQGLFAEVE